MRNAFHIVISLAMWCLFGYYWYLVLGREVGPETVRAMITLVVAVLVGLAATMVWIGHNVRLARKFAGRRQVARAATETTLEHDTIGRTVQHPGLDVLRQAAVIDIDADQETKRYQVAGATEAP